MLEEAITAERLIALVEQRGNEYNPDEFYRKASAFVRTTEGGVRKQEENLLFLRTYIANIKKRLQSFDEISLEHLADVGTCICYLEHYVHQKQDLFKSFGIPAISNAHISGSSPAFFYATVGYLEGLSRKRRLTERELKKLFEKARDLIEPGSLFFKELTLHVKCCEGLIREGIQRPITNP